MLGLHATRTTIIVCQSSGGQGVPSPTIVPDPYWDCMLHEFMVGKVERCVQIGDGHGVGMVPYGRIVLGSHMGGRGRLPSDLSGIRKGQIEGSE
jgi:hypothetical protein